MDRGRREKVIRKMFTEDDYYPFTDLEGESRSKKCGDGRGGQVAHDVSCASEKGTKRLVRLPMSLMRFWA